MASRLRITVVLFCLLISAGCAAGAHARFREMPRVESARGMVVSDCGIASRVGVEILQQGGNAVDAAVATAFALAVTLPEAGNIGGGGFIVAKIGNKHYALDFRETAPASATRDMFLNPDGSLSERSLTGPQASGVPGSVAGLYDAHHRFGKLPWRDLVLPAVAIARDGFRVGPELARALETEAPRLLQFKPSAELFTSGGAVHKRGYLWKNPDLAETLLRIAASGPWDFYHGETARLLVEEMKRSGGNITREDLQQYRAMWREPLEWRYRRHKVVSMPPPSSGGVVLAMMHGMLQKDPAGASTDDLYIHGAAEAMRRAFAARNAALGDPDFVNNPVDIVLSPAWQARQWSSYQSDRATLSTEIRPDLGGGNPGDDGMEGTHTTHFSVVDEAGDAVACTTTLNTTFGSAVTVGGAGFLLNNEMDDFAAKPGFKNTFGLVQGEANAIVPRKRMLSSMTPVIITDSEGAIRLVAGAAGGPTIITAVSGIIYYVLDRGMDAHDAVSAPRFHHQQFPDMLRIEAGGFSDTITRALEARGHKLQPVRAIADANAISRERRPDGTAVLVAGADPRRAAAAAAQPGK